MSSYLNGHALWLNDMDFVPVSTPDMFVGYHSHTADGVVGLPQIQQVIVLQVPLTIYAKHTIECQELLIDVHVLLYIDKVELFCRRVSTFVGDTVQR